MFSVTKTTRTIVAAAFAIAAVTGAGASRALASEDANGCSGVAQARNDAVAALHQSWQAASEKLEAQKELVTAELSTLKNQDENKDEDRDEVKDKAGHMAREVLEVLRNARKDLSEIRKDARRDIRELVRAAFRLCRGGDDQDKAPTTTTVDLPKLTAGLTLIVEQAKLDFGAVVDKVAADVKTAIGKATADAQKKDHDKAKVEKKDEEHEEDD